MASYQEVFGSRRRELHRMGATRGRLSQGSDIKSTVRCLSSRSPFFFTEGLFSETRTQCKCSAVFQHVLKRSCLSVSRASYFWHLHGEEILDATPDEFAEGLRPRQRHEDHGQDLQTECGQARDDGAKDSARCPARDDLSRWKTGDCHPLEAKAWLSASSVQRLVGDHGKTSKQTGIDSRERSCKNTT